MAPGKNFYISRTLALAHQENRRFNNVNNEFSGIIQLALQAPPTTLWCNTDGSFYEFTSADNYSIPSTNPLFTNR